MTYQDIINNSLSILGVIAAGETPSASDTATSLSILQVMFDGWNIQQVAIYKSVRQLFALSGAQAYTIGSGATWNTARPLRILGASVISSNGASQPCKVASAAEFAAANNQKTQNGLFADALYCDFAHPVSTVSLTPIPAFGGQIELFMWQSALTTPSAASDTADLPPGFLEAIQYNLAVRLAAPFGKSLQLTPEVAELAASLKQALGTVNAANQNPNTPPVAPAPAQQ